jgi:hypothetical protein
MWRLWRMRLLLVMGSLPDLLGALKMGKTLAPLRRGFSLATDAYALAGGAGSSQAPSLSGVPHS